METIKQKGISMATPRQQLAEELPHVLASHGVYDGKTSLYFQPEVDEFAKDILALFDKYALERENAARLDELRRVYSGAQTAASKRGGFSARELNYWDFDYYIYLRGCELKGEKPVASYQEYVESQRG